MEAGSLISPGLIRAVFRQQEEIIFRTVYIQAYYS